MKTDPKKSAGDQKDPLHLFPTAPLRSTSRVLKLGADKYGIFNWRHSDGVSSSTYIAAILRHLTQFTDGENVDAESGESHLSHIMATCAILLDADRVGKLIDDRPKFIDVCINQNCGEQKSGLCTLGSSAQACSGRIKEKK